MVRVRYFWHPWAAMGINVTNYLSSEVHNFYQLSSQKYFMHSILRQLINIFNSKTTSLSQERIKLVSTNYRKKLYVAESKYDLVLSERLSYSTLNVISPILQKNLNKYSRISCSYSCLEIDKVKDNKNSFLMFSVLFRISSVNVHLRATP